MAAREKPLSRILWLVLTFGKLLERQKLISAIVIMFLHVPTSFLPFILSHADWTPRPGESHF